MPFPSYVISACAFICERILQEIDYVFSAIRMVEIFYVGDPPAGSHGALPVVPKRLRGNHPTSLPGSASIAKPPTTV